VTGGLQDFRDLTGRLRSAAMRFLEPISGGFLLRRTAFFFDFRDFAFLARNVKT
jgi:hypothetical protein